MPVWKFTYLDFFAAIGDAGDRVHGWEAVCTDGRPRHAQMGGGVNGWETARMSATAYAGGRRRAFRQLRARLGGGAHAGDRVHIWANECASGRPHAQVGDRVRMPATACTRVVDLALP